jgi:site-specific recombinase XerD
MPSSENLPATIAASEISANLREHAEAARDAYAKSTERAFKGDVALFTGWCLQEGRQAMPASPETVVAFIDAMAVSKAPASIRRYVSSVAAFHRQAKVADPCRDGDAVKLALKRMHRTLGRAQRQAAPLSDGRVEGMLRAAGTALGDLRNKALLVVAYTTMARRSELVALLREDLQVDSDGFGTVVIRRGKTDQEGKGEVAPITQDAMRHLQAWVDATGIEDGFLFRRMRRGGHVGAALHAGEVASIFKAMALKAGLSAKEIEEISGHSTRVGAAQDMLRYGEQLPAIMQAGRWKTAEMVGRYTAKQEARQSAAARIAERRVKF